MAIERQPKVGDLVMIKNGDKLHPWRMNCCGAYFDRPSVMEPLYGRIMEVVHVHNRNDVMPIHCSFCGSSHQTPFGDSRFTVGRAGCKDSGGPRFAADEITILDNAWWD